MTGANFSSWYNAAAGTVLVEAAGPTRQELMGANSFPSAWQMQGASSNDSFRIPLTVAADSTDGRRAARFDVGGVSQGDSAVTAAGALAPGPRVATVAATWANPGNYKAALRGQLSTPVTPASGYPTLNQVQLSQPNTYVKLRRVRFFNVTFTDEQLAAATAS